jgi:hypothetical protein
MEKIANITNCIITLAEAPERLAIGERVYMSDAMGEGENIVEIIDKGKNWIVVKGDKLSLRMQTDQNFTSQKVKINIGGIEKEIIVKPPTFRKAPELNQ